MISIVILHHDKAEYSRACLQSLLCSTARPLEVINIDNGSSDDTPSVLDTWEEAAPAGGIETRRHRFETNAGAISGRNTALEMTRGEHLVFLDNDTMIGQCNWLENLRTLLETTPQCGIVAPKLIFPWKPFLIECCGCGVSPRGRIQYIGRGEPRQSLNEPREVQCAISAAWMMTRLLYEKIGPLDEAYSPVQYEDLDYCYRARVSGYTVWTQPTVELFHFEHTTTSQSEDINFKYVTTKNGILFKNRWSSMFRNEYGPDDAATAWKALVKYSIDEVDWRALLPR